MLPHHTRERKSDKFRGFSYRKVLKDSDARRYRGQSKVIAWDVLFKGDKLATLDTLKEVKHFIEVRITNVDTNSKV